MSHKTNAARLLEKLGLPYQLKTYPPEPDDLSPERLSRELSLPPEQIFKTLVVRGERTGVMFAVIPLALRLDLKALARLAGDKGVDVVPLKEVQPLTGYVRGGVTALAARKDYPVFVDETIELFDVISVSAGAKGEQLLVAPSDYLRATQARVGALAVGD
ncbi:aminoacyl-tRNA deacylase [Anaeromyxobacter paludicola]|uniref:aminoacyl-tRNA deacylase n=1 Tax=Anaeromyxobacter paludicola TaxID=2918171 RepID=UPI00298CEA3A|nr:aminoacyl-tRNA deacylase [Anaeromyxobacter paludicola]